MTAFDSVADATTPLLQDPSIATATPADRPLVELEGWGRMPKVLSRIRAGEDLMRGSMGAGLSRGLGRAYGDAALPAVAGGRPVLLTTFADRILGFDQKTGILRAEAGFSLKALREIFLPRGWFTPVAPGTRYVTLGGMVAADIHGKNHHVAGCISQHVRSLLLRTGDGRVLRASNDEHRDLFQATFGGMGLTGHVLEVELALEKVPSPWIYEESERFGSLREVVSALNAAAKDWPMTVAWIDTSARGAQVGRGIVMRGRWAQPHEAPPHAPKPLPVVTIPFDWPNGLVNPTTIGWMNSLWYLKHGAKARRHVVHPEKFFWILDSFNRWNRVFGRQGFVQYQCVLPSSVELYSEMIARFQSLGGCSFVTVFKDCGVAGFGPLSFPQSGTSLALDIPYQGDKTKHLVDELNKLVIAHGGRIYLAKDALTSAADFRAMYPRLDEFLAVVQKYDPDGRLVSHQSQRLLNAGALPGSAHRSTTRPRASTTASRLPGPQVQTTSPNQSNTNVTEVLAASESVVRPRSESSNRLSASHSVAPIAAPDPAPRSANLVPVATSTEHRVLDDAKPIRPLSSSLAPSLTPPAPPPLASPLASGNGASSSARGSGLPRPRSRTLPPPAVKDKA